MANDKPVVSNFNKGINVSVWEQVSKDGKEYYSVSVQRKYKDKHGQEKQETIHTFPDDLLPLVELLRNTYNDLMAYRYKKRKEQKNILKQAWENSEEAPF